MKRKYRETQKRVDETLLAAIESGITSNVELKRVLTDGWAGYSVGELVDSFARSELSAAKQRLRAEGKIEITKGNEPKPMGQLTLDDAEFIDTRRASQIAGQLKSRVQFNHRFGRTAQAEEAAKQLALFDMSEEPITESVDAEPQC